MESWEKNILTHRQRIFTHVFSCAFACVISCTCIHEKKFARFARIIAYHISCTASHHICNVITRKNLYDETVYCSYGSASILLKSLFPYMKYQKVKDILWKLCTFEKLYFNIIYDWDHWTFCHGMLICMSQGILILTDLKSHFYSFYGHCVLYMGLIIALPPVLIHDELIVMYICIKRIKNVVNTAEYRILS